MCLGVALQCGCPFSSTAKVVPSLHPHIHCFIVALLPCSPHFPTPKPVPNPSQGFSAPTNAPHTSHPLGCTQGMQCSGHPTYSRFKHHIPNRTTKQTPPKFLIFLLSKHPFPTPRGCQGKIGMTENIDSHQDNDIDATDTGPELGSCGVLEGHSLGGLLRVQAG